MEFIFSNLSAIFAIAAAAHGLALAIVNLTPTPKDDEVVAKIYRVVEMLAGVFTSKIKQ